MARKNNSENINKAVRILFSRFKKATQKKAFNKAQKQLAAKAFVTGVVALAEAGNLGLATEDWDEVYAILSEKLMDFDF